MATKKLASLLVKIGVNGVEVEKEFRALEKKAENFGKNLQSFGKKFSVAVTAPLIAAGYGAAKAADVQLKAEARLLTALKGREDIQQRLITQAGDIQSRSTFGDEEIIAQQANLASLGLTESQIKRVIDASVELSVATGSSLDSAVRNLAKTFGGLTGELGESIPALKNLTKEQLMNGEAVQYIIDNYKGYAETTLEGLGSTEQLKNMIGDLGEQLGAVLLPVIKDVVSGITDFVKWMQQLSPITQKVILGVAAFVAAIGPLTLALGKMATAFKGVYAFLKLAPAAFTAMLSPIGAVVAAVAALAAGWGLAALRQQAYKQSISELKDEAYNNAYQRFIGMSEEELAGAKPSKPKDMPSRSTRAGRKERGDVMKVYLEELRAYKDVVALRERERNEAERIKNEVMKTTGGLKIQSATIERTITKVEGIKTTNPFGVGQNLRGALMTDISKGLQHSSWMTNLTNQWKEWEEEASGIKELASSIAATLESAAEEVAVSIGEGLGNLITGETFNPVSKILEIFGKTLKTLGSALVSFAITMEAFKESLKTIFADPWAAIATGVAAIAAGAIFMKMAKQPIKLAKGGLAYAPTLAVVGDNPNAASDPEVIAPLSKLRSMGAANRLELVGEVEWKISGSSLRAVLGKENFRLSRLG